MRTIGWVLVAAVLAAPIAAAQTPLTTDSKASLSGAAGEHFAKTMASGGFKTKAAMRDMIRAIMTDGVQPDERDFLAELASGTATTVAVGQASFAVEPLAEDVKGLPQTLVYTPNLHQLWHVGGGPTEQLVEISRWGDAAHQRIYTFIGNQLDDAWKASTLFNAFQPYVAALGQEWKAMETLPDVETRTLAYDLLTTGIAYGIEKAKAEGREPPKDFLYVWVAGEDMKKSFIDGK